ncbi:MAG TPA: hypothetical protein DDW76_22590 [Cyanobacteria bacterium UBA11369]|nr:hypothetical protein [Cyanobacteria bacterium UBA11371]HBE34937.1 hypothetical protein [Cyanobacteria bacterium UBA11368]HBE51488.1 hypothetical protein [Cyanobacteria bacterium UBA11369]
MSIEEDGKDRKTKIVERSQVGNLYSESGSMGTSANSCIKYGHDQIGVSGEDRPRRSASESDFSNGKRNIGKILRELRELRKAHLEYVKAHEQRLEQLEQEVIGLLEDIEEPE